MAVSSATELVQAVKAAHSSGRLYCVIAGGSNVVFDDNGFKGLVIQYQNPKAKIQIEGDKITVEAGTSLAALVKAANRAGREGLESLAGIPGTVAGAVVCNAGAYVRTISDFLESVEVYNPSTSLGITKLTKAQSKFSYRTSIFKSKKAKDWLVLSATFKLPKGDSQELTKRSREIIKIREAKYKPRLKCPGSYFKNVLLKDISAKSNKLINLDKVRDGKIPAGYLLEEVGACGMRKGGICVASFHGNLLINDGTGTAKQAKSLATELKKRVQKRFGIELEEEIRYML